MRRHLLVLLVFTLSLPALSQAGWFTKEPSPSHEQLIRNEERLTVAQQEINNQRQRLQSQQQTISQLNTAIIAVVPHRSCS